MKDWEDMLKQGRVETTREEWLKKVAQDAQIEAELKYGEFLHTFSIPIKHLGEVKRDVWKGGESYHKTTGGSLVTHYSERVGGVRTGSSVALERVVPTYLFVYGINLLRDGVEHFLELSSPSSLSQEFTINGGIVVGGDRDVFTYMSERTNGRNIESYYGGKIQLLLAQDCEYRVTRGLL